MISWKSLAARAGTIALVSLASCMGAAAATPEADEGYLTSDKNWIAGLKSTRHATGFNVDFDYHYTGSPAGATIFLRQPDMRGDFKAFPMYTTPRPASAGFAHYAVPLAGGEPAELTVVAELKAGDKVLATRTLKVRPVYPTAEEMKANQPAADPAGRPAPDHDTIASVTTKRHPNGRWSVDFDYFYLGEPQGAKLSVVRGDGTGTQRVTERSATATSTPAYAGWHRQSIMLERPGRADLNFTAEVTVELLGPKGQPLARDTQPARIEWPSHRTMQLLGEIGIDTPDEIARKAALLIDTNETASVEKAKAYLERALEQDPRADAAYIEMARANMKLNWGPEGLKQAEQSLDTAIKIRDTTNARIVLAYVYAFQKRFPQAEALLADAARRNPPNLWLWTNWGDLEELRGNTDKAIVHYMETLARPATGNTYDRAREYSFIKLFPLLDARKDYDAMEKLHRQRTAEYGSQNCHGVAYARFMVDHRTDTEAAIALARKVQDGTCDKSEARATLGLAYYAAWARDGKRSELLDQARVYLPAGARLFHELAQSDGTAAVARHLIAAGEKVDTPDNAGWTALGHALQEREHEAIARLLALGARPDAVAGEPRMPIALVPVFMKDEKAIRLLQRAGVDYTTLRFQGTSAVEMARQAGERDLARVLESKPGT